MILISPKTLDKLYQYAIIQVEQFNKNVDFLSEERRINSMSLVKEYYESFENPPQDKAKRILFAVFNDLDGRKGLLNEWGMLDDDIQEEILETNLEIIRQNLKE
ncbi:hypothetical protein KJ841_02870 [Patescibacteria group bacterium]|nr:hypothetical protein [Patescibacteria group bacterium]